MTKLTEMTATDRRSVARYHRVEANLAQTEKSKLKGFSPRVIQLTTKVVFHTAQAKLWEVAAAQAEAAGFVSL